MESYRDWARTFHGAAFARRSAERNAPFLLPHLAPGRRVVDVGCGPGGAVRVAARRGATATGVDPARVMLKLAHRLTWRQPGIQWSRGAAEALPLNDASADVVWSIATVHHWPDIQAGLAEAQRVLVPGGIFLAIERRTRPGAKGLGSHGWTDPQAEAFAESCRTAGFHRVEVRTYRPSRATLLGVSATRRR